MSIVDRLKHLSTVGTVIVCPEMTLLAGDHEPPVVIGQGRLTVLTPMTFGYELVGTPDDVGHALRSLRRIESDPYDGRLRERLDLTTADGLSLSGGWTIPKVHVPGAGEAWTFTGEIDSLSSHDNGEFEAGTEVAYLLPRNHLARLILRRFMDRIDEGSRRRKSLTVNGAEVLLILEDDDDLLIVKVPANGFLRTTFIENWLGEPLRILFGQLVFPRFVLRQTEIWSMGWVRPSPAWSSEADACALWQGPEIFSDREGFWENYRRLLSFVAAARNAEGHQNFESNRLTELYGEVIQASHGSRWVWALTYASAAEGVVDLLGLERSPRIDLEADELATLTDAVVAFKAYVGEWAGDPRPIQPAMNAADRMLRTTTAIALRHLKKQGHVSADEYAAWDRLRNRVMHGRLVSPYSSAEDDKLLLDLAGLLHALTRRLIADVDPDAPPT